MVFDFSAIKREKEWLIIARETNDEKASGHGKPTFSKRYKASVVRKKRFLRSLFLLLLGDFPFSKDSVTLFS